MATEAEWQAALEDLREKRTALRLAESAFELADRKVAKLYRERLPAAPKPWHDLEHTATDDCPSAECMDCGARDCPHGEPLHYHHDGCPACTRGDD